MVIYADYLKTKKVIGISCCCCCHVLQCFVHFTANMAHTNMFFILRKVYILIYFLQSLAHVMSLYVHGSYNKGAQTWVSVVCKYVHETFPDALEEQLSFLSEMLDKGNS